MRKLFTLFLLLCASTFADSVAGLKWTAPAGWKSEASRPMRAATYTVPAAPGDSEGGECVVYFFGQGQGGSVEANILRWKGQFIQPDGKPAEAQVKNRKVNSLAVTTVETTGQYSGMGGPMAAQKTTKPNYRLLGAIIENSGGNVFLKFTGPVKTVTANQAKFEKLLASFVKE